MSTTDFLEQARKRLIREGYSHEVMAQIIEKARMFGESDVAKEQRDRIKTFLQEVQNVLSRRTSTKQRLILKNRKAFKRMDAKLLLVGQK